MKPVIFLHGAEEEMSEAARYYEQRNPGLGEMFLLRTRVAVRELAESPRAYTPIRAGIRRKLLRQFPYGVLYREDETEIVIIAIAHLRRRPGYWTRRTRGRSD